MPNAFAACQAELAACQSAEFGSVCVATIGPQTVAAVIREASFDEIVVAGGLAENGGQIVTITKALLTSFADPLVYPQSQPPKFTPMSVFGVEMFVLGVNESNGILTITGGDPAKDS